MATEKRKIKFHDIFELWEFAKQIRPFNIEVNSKDNILTCDCGEPEIMLAKDGYNAQIIRQPHIV